MIEKFGLHQSGSKSCQPWKVWRVRFDIFIFLKYLYNIPQSTKYIILFVKAEKGKIITTNKSTMRKNERRSQYVIYAATRLLFWIVPERTLLLCFSK
jgi:hypothetical protein